MSVLTRLSAHVCVRVRAGFGVVLRVDFVLRVQAQGSGFRAPVFVERCSLKRPQRCPGKWSEEFPKKLPKKFPETCSRKCSEKCSGEIST